MNPWGQPKPELAVGTRREARALGWCKGFWSARPWQRQLTPNNFFRLFYCTSVALAGPSYWHGWSRGLANISPYHHHHRGHSPPQPRGVWASGRKLHFSPDATTTKACSRTCRLEPPLPPFLPRLVAGGTGGPACPPAKIRTAPPAPTSPRASPRCGVWALALLPSTARAGE